MRRSRDAVFEGETEYGEAEAGDGVEASGGARKNETGKRKREGGTVSRAALASILAKSGQSAIGRTLPSLTRFSTTVWAIAFGTASYCLKIIVNEPRPCVTVRIAFE